MFVQFSQSCFQATVIGDISKLCELKKKILEQSLVFLTSDDFYLVHNGKILREESNVQSSRDEIGEAPKIVHVVPRLVGGKGGFGSMLRAIGAQIEKTTNRDACRDLSGRRLRDINEEQRLKKWFAKQAEREQEREAGRKRKLDKLRHVADGPPLPKIDDQEYLKKREDMVDAVFDSVDEAFRDESTEEETSSLSSVSTPPSEDCQKSNDSQEDSQKSTDSQEDSKKSTDSQEDFQKSTDSQDSKQSSSSSMSIGSTSSILSPTISQESRIKKTLFEENVLDTESDTNESSEDELEEEEDEDDKDEPGEDEDATDEPAEDEDEYAEDDKDELTDENEEEMEMPPKKARKH